MNVLIAKILIQSYIEQWSIQMPNTSADANWRWVRVIAHDNIVDDDSEEERGQHEEIITMLDEIKRMGMVGRMFKPVN